MTKKKSSTKNNIEGVEDYISTKRRNIVADVRKGRIVSLDFFRRNGWLIIFFTVVILVLIGMRYRTRVYMTNINKLRVELKKAQNDCLEQKATYMSLIREKDMVELTQRHNLGLVFTDKPPYLLKPDAVDSVAHRQ